MNKLLLTFFALFATLTTALAADPGFSADKLYRIDCACYAGQGAVVLGAKHDQTIYLYYLQGTSYPDDAWWHIEPVGDGSYTFRNAVNGQYMTADDDLYDTTTGKYLKLTDTDEGDMSHWTFEETTYNNQTYYKVKCVSSAISNPYFNMRTSAYMLGGYDADKVSLCATGLPLSQQWCFVGSADEGYKIYNRARQQYLVSNGTNNTFGTEDEASIFLLSTSTATTGAKPYYCWRVAKNKYLAMNDGATALAVGTTTNAQASWQFTPNNSYVLAYAQTYANIPEGALGMPAYLAEADHLAQYKAVYEAAAANATDANIAALVAMTQQIEQGGSPSVDIDNLNGGYYRIVNASTTGAHHMLAVQSAGTTLSTIAPTTANADAVWQLSQIATSGQLALYHPNHAQYVQANRAEVGEGAQAYSLTAQGKAMFALQANDNALTEAADGTVELTANATSANAGCWYLVPATTLDVNLNAVADGRSYATVYLPFGISHVEGAEAYVGDAPLDGRINVTATESFAAKTGILLVSNESNDQATLTIGQGDNLYSAISGSLVQFSISDAERTDYLVFGRNAADLAQVGFFTPQRTTLSANRGFVRTDAYEALTLNFDRITTATGAVKQQSGNAPVYYDLTGRRVLNPLKGGIYITGGRKVVF